MDPARIAVLGTSRGGELALLLGASFASVRAVIGYSASGVVHAGLGEPGKPPPSAWTRAGEPLPFVPMDPTAVDWRPPIRLAPGFSAGLRDAAAVARAEIAVERARGPVLLFSGEEDAMWPAAEMAEIAVRRLAGHHFPHAVEHRVYEGAGHGIGLPGLPTSLTRMLHPVTGQVYELGGTPEANARASRDAWARVLAFLAALQEE